MPKLPVAVNELPTEPPPMPTDIVYTGRIRESKYSGIATNGMHFGNAMIEIMEPLEFRGRVVFDNYIPVPVKPHDDPFYRLKNFILAFNIPYDDAGFDFEEGKGCEGNFTVSEPEEYKGKKTQKVADYIHSDS